jgi:hypothetical protein
MFMYMYQLSGEDSLKTFKELRYCSLLVEEKICLCIVEVFNVFSWFDQSEL